jgi:hypothetical protein
VVQIHSPRPATHKTEDINERLECRTRMSISADDSFPAQINALRCSFICQFCFHFTDNTDNCRCAYWKVPSAPSPLVRGERNIITCPLRMLFILNVALTSNTAPN